MGLEVDRQKGKGERHFLKTDGDGTDVTFRGRKFHILKVATAKAQWSKDWCVKTFILK